MLASKLFKRIVLMVSMLGMLLLAMPGISSAADVWCYSSGGFSYYLSSDTVKETNQHPSYRGMVKVVTEDSGKQWNVIMCGFASENDVITAYTFDRSNGRWGYYGKASDDPFLNAVWQAMKPYL